MAKQEKKRKIEAAGGIDISNPTFTPAAIRKFQQITEQAKPYVVEANVRSWNEKHPQTSSEVPLRAYINSNGEMAFRRDPMSGASGALKIVSPEFAILGGAAAVGKGIVGAGTKKLATSLGIGMIGGETVEHGTAAIRDDNKTYSEMLQDNGVSPILSTILNPGYAVGAGSVIKGVQTVNKIGTGLTNTAKALMPSKGTIHKYSKKIDRIKQNLQVYQKGTLDPNSYLNKHNKLIEETQQVLDPSFKKEATNLLQNDNTTKSIIRDQAAYASDRVVTHPYPNNFPQFMKKREVTPKTLKDIRLSKQLDDTSWRHKEDFLDSAIENSREAKKNIEALYKNTLDDKTYKMLVENPTYTDFINNHYKSTGELLNPKDYSTFQSFMQKQQKSIRGAYTKKNSDNITDIMTDNSYRDTGGDVGDLLKTEGGKYSSNSVGVAEDYMKFAGDKTKGVKSYIGEVETNFNIPKDIPIEDALKAYRQQILPNSGNLTEIPNEFLRKKGFTVKENPYSTVSKPAYERSSISGTDNLNLTGLEYKGKNLAKNKNFGINAESSESYFSPNKFGDSFSDKKLMLEYLDTKPIGKINYTNKAKELAPVTQERMYPYFYNELYKNKINTLQEQLSNTWYWNKINASNIKGENILMKFNSNANKLKKTIDTTNKIGLGLGVVNTGLAIKTLLSDNESDDNKETKNNNEDLAKDFYEKLDNSNQKKYGGVLNNNNDMKRKKRQYGNRFANGSFLNPQTNNLYGNDMNLFNGLPIPQQQNPFQPLQQQNQRNINFNNWNQENPLTHTPVGSPVSSMNQTMKQTLTNAPMPSLQQQEIAAPAKEGISGEEMAGKIGNVASGATGLIGNIAGNLKVPEIQQMDTNANTKGVLANKASNFKGYDVGRSNTAGSALSGAASGAQIGSVVGPVGAVIGGAVGAIGGAVSSIFGNKKKKRAERRANEQTVRRLNSQNTAINSNDISQQLAQEYALGGALMNGNMFGCGGKKFAYGGNFSNGVNSFNTGDTHDNNPNGGIPVGIGENGEPNLVEENEVKWNDYIFSDRMKVPKFINEFNLPKNLKNKSFANSAERLSRESQERPLDPISRRGLNTSLSKLAAAQETVREEKEGTQYAFGGALSLNIGNNPLVNNENPISSIGYQSNDYNPNIKANGGWVHNSNGNDQMGNYLIRGGNFFDGGGKIDYNSEQNLNYAQEAFAKGLKDFNSISGSVVNVKDFLNNVKTQTGIDYMSSSEETKPKSWQELADTDKSSWLGNKSKHSDEEIMAHLKKTFGDKTDKALKVLEWEGGYDPIKKTFNTGQRQFNKMKDGFENTDRGIFQFSTKYHSDFNDEDADDAIKSIDRAFEVSKGGTDWSKWTSAADREKTAKKEEDSQTRDYGDVGTTKQEQVPPEVPADAVNGKSGGKKEVTPETLTESTTTAKTNTKSGKHPLRYAPVAANALLTGMAMSASPDRINLGRIAPMQLGDRMSYNPIDSDYTANQMRQQGANLQRGITDASGGNRAIASAGMLAANRSSQDAIGNALLQGREYNDNKLKEVKTFNRDTNMFNIKNDLAGQEYNTNALNQERLWNKQADASRRNAIRQGIATIGTSLGQIGTENRWMEVAQNLGDGYDSMGRYNTARTSAEKNKPVAAALGGKIYYKKRIK